jgi:metal-responsive CopG/Arc/MetJ family transcriptional regulator
MGDSKTTTTFTVAVTEKQLERIDREAERDRRNRSNFIKSIVLPEIERRERDREEEAIPA